MKKILLVGYFGFDNFGDEWLLNVFIRKVSELTADSRQIFVLYNVNKITVKEKNVVYLPRWNFRYILRFLIPTDTVVFCGGIFQDETSVLSLGYYLFILFLAKILAKKVVLLSTDFVLKRAPWITQRSIIFLSDAILVRNTIDVQNMKTYFGTSAKIIRFSPDLCLLEHKRGNFSNNVSSNKCIKTIGLVLKFNLNVKLVQQMCMYLSKYYKLVFIPFNLRQDYKFCLNVIDSLTHCEIRIWDDIKNYENIFSDIDLVISSRLHGIILAMLLQIPFICVSSEEKLRRLLRSYFAVEPVTLEQLGEKNYDISNFAIFPENRKLIEYKQSILSNMKFLVDKDLL